LTVPADGQDGDHRDERTRLSLSLLVTYEGTVERARELVERSARNVEDVITDGPDIRDSGGPG